MGPIRKERSYAKEEIDQLSKFPSPRRVDDPPSVITRDHLNWKRFDQLKEQTLPEAPQPVLESENTGSALVPPGSSIRNDTPKTAGMDVSHAEQKLRRLKAQLQQILVPSYRRYLESSVTALENLLKEQSEQYEDINDYEMQHPFVTQPQVSTPAQHCTSNTSDSGVQNEAKPKVAKFTKKALRLSKSLHNLKDGDLINMRKASAEFGRSMDEEKSQVPRTKLTPGEYFTNTTYSRHIRTKVSPTLYDDKELQKLQKMQVKTTSAGLANIHKAEVKTNDTDLVDFQNAPVKTSDADLIDFPNAPVHTNYKDIVDFQNAQVQTNDKYLVDFQKAQVQTNDKDLVGFEKAQVKTNDADPVDFQMKEVNTNYADLLDLQNAQMKTNVTDLVDTLKIDMSADSTDFANRQGAGRETSETDLIELQDAELKAEQEYYEQFEESYACEGTDVCDATENLLGPAANDPPEKNKDKSAETSAGSSHKHDAKDQKSNTTNTDGQRLLPQNYVSSEHYRRLNDSVFPIPKSISSLERSKADARIYERTKEAARRWNGGMPAGQWKNLLSIQPKVGRPSTQVPATAVASARPAGTNTFGWTQAEKDSLPEEMEERREKTDRRRRQLYQDNTSAWT